MSFLKIFKRKNVPGLEEDFIQDPTDRLIEEGRAGKTGRLQLKLDTTEEESRKKLRERMDEFNEDIYNPSSEASPLWNDPWD